MLNLLEYFCIDDFDYYTSNCHTDDLEEFVEHLLTKYDRSQVDQIIWRRETFMSLFNSYMETLVEETEEDSEISWSSEAERYGAKIYAF